MKLCCEFHEAAMFVYTATFKTLKGPFFACALTYCLFAFTIKMPLGEIFQCQINQVLLLIRMKIM